MRKIFSYGLLVLILIVGLGAAALFVGASTPTRGMAYIGYHCDGDSYPQQVIAVAREDYRNTGLALEVYGWEMTNFSNNWQNVITPTVSGNTIGFAFAPMGSSAFNAAYVGPSANINFDAKVTGLGGCSYSKVGFFTWPTVTTTTINLNPVEFVSNGETLGKLAGDGTEFVVDNLLDGTHVEAFLGNDLIPLGVCNATSATTSCTFTAPNSTTFSEWEGGWKYIHLKFEAVPGTTPNSVGIRLPVPTPTPTVVPTLVPTPTP